MAPTWHANLPWREALRAYRFLRRLLFTADRPTGEYVRTTAPLSRLRAALGGVGYAPAWKFSYDKGADLNLAWVYHHPAGEWRQTHVRVWHADGVRYLSAHDETTPEEHPKRHLRESPDRERGMEDLRYDLTGLGIDYDVVEWPAEA